MNTAEQQVRYFQSLAQDLQGRKQSLIESHQAQKQLLETRISALELENRNLQRSLQSMSDSIASDNGKFRHDFLLQARRELHELTLQTELKRAELALVEREERDYLALEIHDSSSVKSRLAISDQQLVEAKLEQAKLESELQALVKQAQSTESHLAALSDCERCEADKLSDLRSRLSKAAHAMDEVRRAWLVVDSQHDSPLLLPPATNTFAASLGMLTNSAGSFHSIAPPQPSAPLLVNHGRFLKPIDFEVLCEYLSARLSLDLPCLFELAYMETGDDATLFHSEADRVKYLSEIVKLSDALKEQKRKQSAMFSRWYRCLKRLQALEKSSVDQCQWPSQSQVSSHFRSWTKFSERDSAKLAQTRMQQFTLKALFAADTASIL